MKWELWKNKNLFQYDNIINFHIFQPITFHCQFDLSFIYLFWSKRAQHNNNSDKRKKFITQKRWEKKLFKKEIFKKTRNWRVGGDWKGRSSCFGEFLIQVWILRSSFELQDQVLNFKIKFWTLRFSF